ncbi:HhH-GPD family protein [Kineococcus sp. SYSU DK004]|uniref:A/G-specific adenine glycosylase n=1 Tax=Kineococcus sp. SYSU DK004 TaxID=3383125 RepID=UPI003D7C7993
MPRPVPAASRRTASAVTGRTASGVRRAGTPPAPGLPPGTDAGALRAEVLDWYATHARDLPWRGPDRTPWGVLVSEVMLQQTPVVRVLPVWREWLERWPEPAALAAEAPGEAVRAWGRLGYPRRALRLHATAVALVERHGGRVPDDHAALLALPGVGAYTAAAVASFAFGRRHAVVDTNVRRVQARAVTGAAEPAPALTAAESRLAEALVPDEEATAARWAVAVMELGALVCTARSPRCPACPLLARCAWVAAGRPEHEGPARRAQAWAGTDRQVRGRLLAVLREAEGPVDAAVLAAAWTSDPAQRARCLDGLVADGLVEPLEDGTFSLPRS